MDPVTHVLTGTLISRAFNRKSRFALGVLIIASILPDIDYVTRFWGTEAFLKYHRGITHSLVALAVVPVIGAILCRATARRSLVFSWFLVAVGYAIHLGLDLTTQYPMRLLAPLDWEGYNLDVAFIVDPYVTGLIVAGILLSLRRNAKKKIIVFIILLCVTLYFSGRYYLKLQAEQFLRTKIDEYRYYLYPLPNDFIRWWFVVQSGSTYKVGFVDLFTGSVCIKKTFEYSEERPEVVESKDLPTVKSFLFFSKHPYVEVIDTNGTTMVKWYELSYYYLPGERFVAIVEFDSLGRATKEEFRF